MKTNRVRFQTSSLMHTLALSTILISQTVMALDLTAPFMLETAQVVPAGVRIPRFTTIMMTVDSKYNPLGAGEPLGQRMNKVVTWGDVLKHESDPSKRLALQAMLQRANLNVEGTAGSTSGEVFVNSNVKVPVLAMGITNRITLALAVPIVSINANADVGFVRSNDGQALVSTLGEVNPVEANTAATKMNNAIPNRLSDYGYEPLGSKTVTHIGDMQVIGKVSAYKDADNQVSVKSITVLPTGIAPNVDALVDLPTGDGRVQLGAGVAYDRTFLKDYRWNVFSDFIAQLPNSMMRRIPEEVDNPVSQDKETLTRVTGRKWLVGTSLTRTFAGTGFSAGAGYTLQMMSGAQYSGGTLFASERYKFLEDLTPNQVMHSATLTAGFSTVEWFLAKKFFYPFMANVYYSHPLKGYNVPTSDVVAGELVMFF